MRFEDYCAPKGVVVAEADVGVCCSRKGRELGFEDFGRVLQEGVLLHGTFRAKVCR